MPSRDAASQPRPKLRVRRYIAGDAALVTPRPEMAAEAAAIADALKAGLVPAGWAWTLELDRAPAAVAGLMPVWPGRWIAWSWIGPLPIRAWREVHVLARRTLDAWLDGARADGRTLRIEATAAHPKGCDWLFKLGFEPEGLMRGYGADGADYALYSRVARP